MRSIAWRIRANHAMMRVLGRCSRRRSGVPGARDYEAVVKMIFLKVIASLWLSVFGMKEL